MPLLIITILLALARLVIIHNLYIKRIAILKAKANAPLLVDANTPLTRSVPFEYLEVIAGRAAQKFNRHCRVELRQLAFCNPLNVAKAWRAAAFEDQLCMAAMEGLDHARRIYRLSISVNSDSALVSQPTPKSPALRGFLLYR
jgi:hypothetical protein